MILKNTKVYSIKRYEITDKLRDAIKKNSYSITNMSKILGFEVKNIVYRNKSINEEHFKRLNFLLNNDFILKEIKFDFTKNFGDHCYSHTIKGINRNENLAEFIGIMLGDGYLGSDVVKVCFDKRNKIYMEYVKGLAKQTFDIELRKSEIKETNQGYLYFYSRTLVLELTKHGLIEGDKIKNQVSIPNWIKENEDYSKRCIKGLIDTDGCIYICKRERQKYIKFTNYNIKLLNDFSDLVTNLNYHFVSANKRNVCLYRKAEVAKFIEDIKPMRSVFGVIR